MLCFVGYSNPDWEYLKLDHAPGYSILRILYLFQLALSALGPRC